MRFRKVAVAVATIALVATGSDAFAAQTNAAALPAVTLEHGVVTITGTAARDEIGVRIDTAELAVDFGFDGATDVRIPRTQFNQVRVLGGEGDDAISASRTSGVPVTFSGGPGNDFLGVLGDSGDTNRNDPPIVLIGDDGNDDFLAATPAPVTISAGPGDDRVDSGPGAVGPETVSLGDGNDRFTATLTTPFGIRQDNVDGGAGHDTMALAGTNETESVGFSGRNGRLVVNHELIDQVIAAGVEDVSYIGFGGSDESGDAIGVNDLSGTGVVHFTADFSAAQGSTEPNNSADTLTVRGTPGIDHIAVSGAKANVLVSGLTPVVTAVNLRPEDFLLIDTLAGNDVVDSSGLQPGLVQLLIR